MLFCIMFLLKLWIVIDKLETIKQNSNAETTNEIDKLIKMLAETIADQGNAD